jgi:sugar/nucleoside kinase (ribokinase family)
VGGWSALGDDAHGRLRRALWAEEGVDAACVVTDAAAFTAICFVTHGAQGQEFPFDRAGSAASRVGQADVPRAAIAAARVLQLSGLSLAISASVLRRRLCRHRGRTRRRCAGVLRHQAAPQAVAAGPGAGGDDRRAAALRHRAAG